MAQPKLGLGGHASASQWTPSAAFLTDQ